MAKLIELQKSPVTVLRGPSLSLHKGLFEKWSALDPKKFYATSFQKLVFLVSLYPEFLEKKNKETKKI